MKNTFIKSSVCIMLLSSAMGCWATNPCMPIAKACMAAGFVKNGPAGKALVKDCVKPVVDGDTSILTQTFDADTLTQCQAMLKQKMSEQ